VTDYDDDQNQTIYNIGIDVGFGDVKVVSTRTNGTGKSATRTIKFPTALAALKNNGLGALDNSIKTYNFKNKHYIVGEGALLCQRVIPTRDIAFLLNFIPLFIFKSIEDLANEFNEDFDDVRHAAKRLCLGLPLGFYSENRKAICEIVKRIAVSGESIEFETVKVHAQGQGILFDCLKPQLREKTFLIVDIGFNTIDILAVDKGRARRDWSTMIYGAGICQICEEVREGIKKISDGLEVSEQEVKESLVQGSVMYYGERIDITDMMNDALEDYADYLYGELYSRLAEFLKRSEKLIIAGGGAYHVGNLLSKKFPGSFVHIPPHAEFSNARGYLKFLQQMP